MAIHQSYCPHHGDYGRTDGKTVCPECEDGEASLVAQLRAEVASFKEQLAALTPKAPEAATNPLHRAISRNHNLSGLRRPEGM